MKTSLCFSLVLGAAVASFGILSSVAAQQPLPDAGQALCTDEAGALVPCVNTGPCPGQDGFYTTGCPLDENRYEIDDGGDFDRFKCIDGLPVTSISPFPPDPDRVWDDVVKDKCTNLMWARSPADFDGDGCHEFPLDSPDWETALAYCEDLVLTVGNGFKDPSKNPLDPMDPDDDVRFDDWRMPNVREIMTIPNWDVDGAIDPTIFFTGNVSFWTSTSRVDLVDSFSRGIIFSGREGKLSFDGTNNKVGGNAIHAVRTMLPGELGAGAGAARGQGAGADGVGARPGGGAGQDCADDNGDVNGDNGIDLSDAVYNLAFLFQGGPALLPFCVAAGPKEEECATMNGDVNGDNGIDLSDAIYSLAFSFQGGPAPVPICGGTPVEEICDGLGVDEDLDGATDCNDSDCIGQAGCPGPEICTGDFDEDGDGATDCTDQDCAQDASCQVAGGTGLPDTGQVTCYSTNAEIIPCPGPGEPFFGQDGSHDTGCGFLDRFTDNGDGTVTDECTGLEWQKDTGNDNDPLLWCEALRYCEDLQLGGHSDWSLPNLLQLHSLVHYGFHGAPMIDPIFADTLGTAGKEFSYWTSTTRWDPTDIRQVAWFVEFNEGTVDPAALKSERERMVGDPPVLVVDPPDELRVRAVRTP